MDQARFRDWFSKIDELTAEQCRKVAAVLSDPPEGEASLASGCAEPCTSRRSTVAKAGSRAYRDASAASPPSVSTAVRGGSISSCSAGIHRRETASPPASAKTCLRIVN